jgi:hypothetical protein
VADPLAMALLAAADRCDNPAVRAWLEAMSAAGVETPRHGRDRVPAVGAAGVARSGRITHTPGTQPPRRRPRRVGTAL